MKPKFSLVVKITIWILVAIVLVVLYYSFLQPLFSLFIGLDISEQTDNVSEQLYLDTKYGDELQNYISSLDVLDNAQPVYFYYGDNWKHDNPIHGRISDIIAVDFKVDAQKYSEFKNSISKGSYDTYKFSESDHYEIYFPANIDHPDVLTFFAINESQKFIRIIFISDAESFKYYSDTIGFLIRWTELSFE